MAASSNTNRFGSKQYTCVMCQKLFSPKASNRTTCCSRECGLRFTGRQMKDRATAVSGRIFHRVNRCKCAYCGVRFEGILTKRTCSCACAKGRAAAAARSKAVASHVTRRFDCRECGAAFDNAYGNKRTSYCSDTCARRVARRADKQVRQARLGGALAERVSPLLVFERDAWRCGICRKMTLKTMRGKAHPRAPELDHIVTLSQGGDHTYANTQCACRQCNGAKGGKTYGQLPLFAL